MGSMAASRATVLSSRSSHGASSGLRRFRTVAVLSILPLAIGGAPAHADVYTDVAAACANPTIVGTDGPDALVGTQGNDVINGMGGNDAIDGGGGNDIVCGGE